MKEADCEPIVQQHPPPVLTIEGSTMKALKIASDEFAASGLDVRNFNVTIAEKAGEQENDDTVFIVTFMGKLSPGKRGLGTANRVPGSVIYFISKEKWKVIKEQGVK